MNDCIFCKMVSKEIPVEFLFENEKVFAINDIAPQAPTHILIIPKEHISDTLQLSFGHTSMIGEIYLVANQLARDCGLDEKGFRVVNNCLEDGGQAVGHLHFHLLGGRKMTWPPG